MGLGKEKGKESLHCCLKNLNAAPRTPLWLLWCWAVKIWPIRSSPFRFPTPAPLESLLAGNPTYKAFLYPICKGVTSSDVSVFENPLICPSSLKRLALVFLKTSFSIVFSWTSVWLLHYERKTKTRKNIYLVKRKRIKVEPRFNEGPRDWQHLFVITRFCYFSLVFYYYWGKITVSYLEDFVL